MGSEGNGHEKGRETMLKLFNEDAIDVLGSGS